jgi:predicted N-acetyltransferase YhbS
MPIDEILIVPLRERRSAIPILARWFFEEWFSLDHRTIDEIQTALAETLTAISIPITFIAIWGDEVVGTVSLDPEDLPGFEHLSPWLASLYVAPAWRGKGVATRLVKHTKEFAQTNRFPKVYLWTPISPALYERCGWTHLQSANYQGQPITVMELLTC